MPFMYLASRTGMTMRGKLKREQRCESEGCLKREVGKRCTGHIQTLLGADRGMNHPPSPPHCCLSINLYCTYQQRFQPPGYTKPPPFATKPPRARPISWTIPGWRPSLPHSLEWYVISNQGSFQNQRTDSCTGRNSFRCRSLQCIQ